MIAKRYRLSHREKAFIEKIIGLHMRPLLLAQEDRIGHLTRRAMIRFVREGADELSGHFLLALADSLAAQGKEKPKDLEDRLKNLWREVLSIREALIRPLGKKQALISGGDLIGLGLTLGPLFKTLLSEIEEARLDGEISSREEALGWVKKRLEPLRSYRRHIIGIDHVTDSDDQYKKDPEDYGNDQPILGGVRFVLLIFSFHKWKFILF